MDLPYNYTARTKRTSQRSAQDERSTTKTYRRTAEVAGLLEIFAATAQTPRWSSTEITLYQYVGKTVDFEDGKSIRIHQIKQREECPWVIFEINEGGNIPRRLITTLYEFQQKFGKLFETRI